jgi:maleylacetate reductase
VSHPIIAVRCVGETVPDSLSFDVTGSPARILFGRGARARCPDVLRDLGISRALVLSTEGRKQDADAFACTLGKSCLGVLAGAVMHTPVSATEAALEIVRESRVDGLVAFGGGSTVGLSKALALRTDLPQVVIPTTYAGSEMTGHPGRIRRGREGHAPRKSIRPEVVIYDVDLTLGLPVGLTMTSALNAIAHAVEGLYAPDRNPILDLMAGHRCALCRGPAAPEGRAGRDRGREGENPVCGLAVLGRVLGYTSMALHHKLAHVLGGSFGLPHAETHAS